MTRGDDDGTGLSGRRLGLMLAGVGLLAFALQLGTVNNELTFDDHWAIERNPNTARPVDLWAHLSSGFWGPGYERRDAAWRPVTTLTFAWNRAAHGVSPGGYHLVNLLLHAAAVVLLALLARALGLRDEHALAAAVVFAVHPLHVDAVASGVGRAELLMTAFGLGALLAWVRGRTVAAVGLLAAALLSKEMAVALAPVMVWHDLARRPDASRWRWAALAGLAALWLAARYAALGTLAGANPSRLENPLVHAGLGTTLLTAGDLYLHAVSLFAAPITLVADYSYATIPPTASASAGAVLGWLLLLATAGGIVASVRRAPVVSVALALWLGPYLIVSHLGPTLPMLFAERTLYLPSAGLCLALAAGLGYLRARPGAYRGAAAVLAIACVAFAMRSRSRVDDWRDDATLQARTMADAPRNIKALCNAALELAALGRMDDARAAVERALAVDDRIALPHLAAASLYITLRMPEDARRHLDRAAELNPDVPRMTATRCAFAASFAPEDAVALCTVATDVPFAGTDAWMFRAIAHDRAGDPAAADAAFQRALAIDPNPRVTLVYNYGIFLARNRRFPEAREMLARAADMAPHRQDIGAALDRVNRTLAGEP